MDIYEQSPNNFIPTITLWPNPTTGCFAIDTRRIANEQEYHIKIYSLSGEELYTTEYSADQLICPGVFTPGAYFITAECLETHFLYRQLLLVQP